MSRVLVLNNYSLERVCQQVRCGDTPDHHLYGINHLQDLGYEIKVVPDSESRAIHALARFLRAIRCPIPMGALDRQWSAWRLLQEADLVYAPCGDELNSLAYLRAAGMLKTPLVAVQHHALNRGRLSSLREPWINLLIRGIDAFPALSDRVAHDINERCRADAPKSKALRWGPDATFYPRSPSLGEGVLAAGRTGRDFVTFGKGASRADSSALIMCLATDFRPEFAAFSANVRVQTPEHGSVYGYPDMMQAHLDARVLAIPLEATSSNLAGLTSLVDAMALGKPVIMTRNPYIDLDIEAQGIGRWVEPADVRGWADAINWFAAHPAESLAMGQRARDLVDNGGYNSRAFALQIDQLFRQALGRESR